MENLPQNIKAVIDSKERDLGGFSVLRMLPNKEIRSVGPFVFFDHMSASEMTPESGLSVRPHPHIGLSTVTYLFEGCIMHRDNLGFKQPIFPGEVNWMTAGKGVVHSERTPHEQELFVNKLNGIQIWVALPKEHEETEASFSNFKSDQLPSFKINDVSITLILGEAFGYKSPVPIYSNMFYFDVNIKSGQSLDLKFSEKEESGIYIASGKVNIEKSEFNQNRMVILKEGSETTINAIEDSRIVVFGGHYLGEPRYMWWNFVSSSKERIEKAKYDWLNNNFGQVIEETEFIPLPDDGYPVLYP